MSRALSEAEKVLESPAKATECAEDAVQDNRPPILRFRTSPEKPFSVSDLTAGSWCELQYYYVLTLLGGKRTRTTDMKRGSHVHEKLKRELYTPVTIKAIKKEDMFGLRIWNIIQGLHTLRDTGLTRELEVWGMVDGKVVIGIIDGLSYENPDQELQDEVLSSRGSSQNTVDPRVESGTSAAGAANHEIYITDVKTRKTPTKPPQAQVRVTLIQLFLYHRFLTQMATDQLDYLRVFERHDLDPDEPFSDSFMVQIGAVHEEIFADIDAESSTSSGSSGHPVDADRGVLVSAPSSPSQLSDLDLSGYPSLSPSQSRKLKYRTLRALIPRLKSEIRRTFPRGAADLGQIVAVEYRYRGDATDSSDSSSPGEEDEGATRPRRRRRDQEQQQPEDGSVLWTNSFFVEPHTLDQYLAETLRWWKGEREPYGVPLSEAYKCRSCEFVEDCEWRKNLDMEAIRRAKAKQMKGKEPEGSGEGGKKRGRKRRTSAAAAADDVSW